jgi:SagB-type dehydrogenase family enzyme
VLPFDDETTLSMLFHLNSEPWANMEAYQNAVYEVEYKNVSGMSPELLLPQPPDTPLTSLASKRASCRAFAPKTLPLQLLSAILWGSYGISRTERILPANLLALLRPVPSAGGLFPLEIYFLAQRVEELPDGLHHYNVRHHSLETVQSAPLFERFRHALLMYNAVKDANVIMFLAAVFQRTQKKYGPRGYRYIFLEAGHIVQNVCLLAAEANLSTLCMGGYSDGEVNLLLGLSPRDEGVVYSVAVGWPLQG